jgi:hypothetical protein
MTMWRRTVPNAGMTQPLERSGADVCTVWILTLGTLSASSGGKVRSIPSHRTVWATPAPIDLGQVGSAEMVRHLGRPVRPLRPGQAPLV